MIDVYCHTSPNGKRYVGLSAKGAKRRWEDHVREARRGASTAFHRAIRKYGPDAFTHEVLERMTTEAGAKRAEQLWIRELGTFGESGYNLTLGGEGSQGFCPSEETRRKRSQSLRGRKRPGVGPAISAAKLASGYRHSAATRVKISESARGRVPPNIGCSMSDVQRAKLSAAWSVRRVRDGHKLPARCHPERTTKARGLCDPCYRCAWRRGFK